VGTITVNLQGNGGQSDSFDWSVLSTTQFHRDHPYKTSSNSTCTSLQYISNIYFKEKYLQQARAELCQAQEKLGPVKSDLSSKKLWLSSTGCSFEFGKRQAN
jgi:hypothetical protein